MTTLIANTTAATVTFTCGYQAAFADAKAARQWVRSMELSVKEAIRTVTQGYVSYNFEFPAPEQAEVEEEVEEEVLTGIWKLSEETPRAYWSVEDPKKLLKRHTQADLLGAIDDPNTDRNDWKKASLIQLLAQHEAARLKG